MIVEVRTYKVKPGMRDGFIAVFESRSIPGQRAAGIQVTGPLLDLEDPDVFIFLRAFPSLDERDRMKSAFYDGDEWKNELEAIVMPMLDTYSAVLTEASPGFVNEIDSGQPLTVP